MPQEIHLSLIPPRAEFIQPFLEQFEREENIQVKLTVFTWADAWNQLVKASLYEHDLDVSEIGSTWVVDLTKMNVLRPFAPNELTALGGVPAFLPAFWNGGHIGGSNEQVAIPWLTGSRLLYYRRSLFAKARIDPALAFSSVETFTHTMHQLREAGVTAPWLVTTTSNNDTLLNVASWIWGSGGEFLAPNGKSTLFARPEALAGIIAYFELGRLLPPEYINLEALDPNYRFLDDPNSATIVSGAWLHEWAKQTLPPEKVDDIGMALPPGASFVGGSYLALWKNCQNTDAAIKLVNFLTQTHTAVNYGSQLGLLPARVQALEHPAFSDTFWQTSIAGLKSGRTFPTTELWGLVQDRLTQEFGNIWKEVLAQPDTAVAEIVTPRIKALARRLDITLDH